MSGKHLCFITLFLLGLTRFSFGQECNCDHTLRVSDNYIKASQLKVSPGDTICIEGGLRTHLALMDFQGTADRPMVFINCGGQVVIENYNLGYGLAFRNSRHFIVSGTGDPGFKYGIKIAGTKEGASGVGIGDLSTDCELEFLEIANTGFAGIMAKTDPRCDGSANRDNFLMKNVRIHDNYIHDTGGEGLYIGNSFYAGWNTTCNGQEVTLYPHDVIGLRVFDNIVENAGWDGIQIGCASQDTEIYGNKVIGYGLSGGDAHTNGIQIGGGTTGKVYNNEVKDGNGNGIIVLGLGDNMIFNNLIIGPGGYGIFCDDRVTRESSQVALINNTIIQPGRGGILSYSEVTDNRVYNNMIIGDKCDITFGQGASGDVKNNHLDKDLRGILNVAAKSFADFSTDDYRLSIQSSAVDAGVDVSDFGIDFDFNGHPRPQGKGYDTGAFEYDFIPAKR